MWVAGFSQNTQMYNVITAISESEGRNVSKTATVSREGNICSSRGEKKYMRVDKRVFLQTWRRKVKSKGQLDQVSIRSIVDATIVSLQSWSSSNLSLFLKL